MATQTSLSMKMTTPSQETTTRSITNVNPDATNAQLTELAEGLVELTNNTLVVTNKVSKEELDYDYELTFYVREDTPNAGLITRVDNNTYTVDKSKIPLTTDDVNHINCIEFATKAGDYNIFDNIKRKLTFVFYPTADDAINPTITIIPVDINGEEYWQLFLFLAPSDQEYIDDLVGFKLVVHIPSGTINGYSYASADLTFNFV